MRRLENVLLEFVEYYNKNYKVRQKGEDTTTYGGEWFPPKNKRLL